ncbi:hypothetical protein B0O80DRAFT_275361 [Mortierella sp. GBAus27b]|nr:hypothetical protein B0O80DRAFT_275361 [Mortierella sp. GBAus27b]
MALSTSDRVDVALPHFGPLSSTMPLPKKAPTISNTAPPPLAMLWKISRFLTPKDTVACAQVCKDWTDDFVSAIWHTIDFDVHNELHDMDAKILAKYGRHIRVMKNIKDRNHLYVLLVSNPSKLRHLKIAMTRTDFYGHLCDFLRRNTTSIETIDIEQPDDNKVPYFTVDAFFPMSTGESFKFSNLKIRGLAMTKDAFTTLLKVTPLLESLTISNTTILS